MKKIILILICAAFTNLHAQDDEHEEKKHKRFHKEHKEREHFKKDYFTAGLYTGSYIGSGPVKEKNGFINSISAELEYFKFKDLSLVVRGTYQFSTANSYDLLGQTEGPFFKYNEPYMYKLNISINGRYYLGRKKVKPYLQTGINQETNFIDNYTTITYNNPTQQIVSVNSYQRSYTYRYTINFGVGVNVYIAERFSFDMKYDLYKLLGRNRRMDFYPTSNDGNGFNGFSVLAGLKYNL